MDSDNVSRIDMMNMFDRTMEDFQNELGYSDKTIARLHKDHFFFDTMDIWFKGPWQRGEFAIELEL